MLGRCRFVYRAGALRCRPGENLHGLRDRVAAAERDGHETGVAAAVRIFVDEVIRHCVGWQAQEAALSPLRGDQGADGARGAEDGTDLCPAGQEGFGVAPVLERVAVALRSATSRLCAGEAIDFIGRVFGGCSEIFATGGRGGLLTRGWLPASRTHADDRR